MSRDGVETKIVLSASSAGTETLVDRWWFKAHEKKRLRDSVRYNWPTVFPNYVADLQTLSEHAKAITAVEVFCKCHDCNTTVLCNMTLSIF